LWFKYLREDKVIQKKFRPTKKAIEKCKLKQFITEGESLEVKGRDM